MTCVCVQPPRPLQNHWTGPENPRNSTAQWITVLFLDHASTHPHPTPDLVLPTFTKDGIESLNLDHRLPLYLFGRPDRPRQKRTLARPQKRSINNLERIQRSASTILASLSKQPQITRRIHRRRDGCCCIARPHCGDT